MMTGNVVIAEAGALIYVALRKAEEHVPYEELNGATECMIL